MNLILNEALRGDFPAEFVDGVVVLVKKKGNNNTARSFRPISLLKVDYKIFSRILKARLGNVMSTHRILSNGQKCSNAERNIFQATLSTRRQGDPNSMHLHPLVSKLERVCRDDLLVAYADDISVISSGVEKIQQMGELFSHFEIVSGARLNMEKTVSIDVRFIDGEPLTVPGLRTEVKIKILGVVYTNSIRALVKLNWNAAVSKFAQLIFLHSIREFGTFRRPSLPVPTTSQR